MSEAEPRQEPFLRICSGTPTEEEVAALVVAFTTLNAEAVAEPGAGSTGWSAYGRRHRSIPRPGPGAWRHSLR